MIHVCVRLAYAGSPTSSAERSHSAAASVSSCASLETTASSKPVRKTRPAWLVSQNISAEAGRGWPRRAVADRDWPRLEAALRLIWRWRGVLKGKCIGRSLWAAVFPHSSEPSARVAALLVAAGADR